MLKKLLIAAAVLLCPVLSRAAGVAVDSQTAVTPNFGQGFSWTHTVGSGNTVLIVGIGTQIGDSVTAVTYNGVSMSHLGTSTASGEFLSIWYLQGAATGSHSVTVTETQADLNIAAGMSFTGAAQTSTPDGFLTGSAASTPMVKSITPSKGNAGVVDFIFSVNDNATLTQTWPNIIARDHTSSFDAIGEAWQGPVTGQQTSTWTISSAVVEAIVAVVPPGGGSGGGATAGGIVNGGGILGRGIIGGHGSLIGG